MAVRTSSLFYREKCGVNSDVVIKIFHSNEQVSMGDGNKQGNYLIFLLIYPFIGHLL